MNTAVWVRNPGPMADVAIRNAAPAVTPRTPAGPGRSPAAFAFIFPRESTV